MDQAIEDFLQRIERSPLDETLRIQLENHLASTIPGSPVLELSAANGKLPKLWVKVWTSGS
jgi:hypothetical protein